MLGLKVNARLIQPLIQKQIFAINALNLNCRFYDRKRYLKEKKRLKSEMNQENVTIPEAFDLLKTYALGQDLPITCVIGITAEEASASIRGTVTFPTPVSEDTESVVLCFANVFKFLIAGTRI
jgi:hypothetical protein